jgi:phage terminase large subunit
VAVLELNFRRLFKPYSVRPQRYACMVAHRRAGKTVACVQDIILKATQLKLPSSRRNAPGRYAYVAPLMSQAKDVAWTYLKAYAQPIVADKNEGELWIELLNRSRIRIYGADNPDRLRGGYLDGCILDEYADMRPSVLGEVVSPMLADYGGWLTMIGTPKGRNAFYEQWAKAQKDPDWFTARYPASETGILSAEELEKSRRTMTSNQYAQEYECSFEAAIMGAYYADEIIAAEREGRIVDGLEFDPTEPVHTAWDLGHAANMAIWVFQVTRRGILILDVISRENTFFDGYLEEVGRRGYGGHDFVPHDIETRSFETGRTRIEAMIAAGRRPIKVPNVPVDDGINAVKLTLPRCIFHRERTAVGVEALRQYRQDWDERRRVFDERPFHNWASHFADGFRYLAVGWREMVAAAAPPKPVEINPLAQVTMDQFMELEDSLAGHGRRI